MQKMVKLLLGFLIAISLPLGLMVNPVTVSAASKKASVSKMETTPRLPQGQDNWYTSATMVEFHSAKSKQIYFQWNKTDGKWQTYNQPFRAWRGENTLYFYSVGINGIKEPVQSKTIKVDYAKPKIESVKSVSVDGQAEITWVAEKDQVKYNIYRYSNGTYRLIGSSVTNKFVDRDVKIGQHYFYQIIAVDQAGLKSKKILTNVVIKVSSQTDQAVAKTSIIDGASTISDLKKQKIETASKKENVVSENPVKTSDKAPVKPARNWSRLLTALYILFVAAGAAIASYYFYEWWMKKKAAQVKPKEKKTNSSSRW
ncbi:MAG: hypothetical protein WCP93_00765 [Candidatus Berkelbacteria bacterium]